MTRSLTIFLLSTMLVISTAEARLYKWVDENGETHYGDSIPPQYQKKKHKVMSEHGQTLKTRDALPTPEEMAAAEKLKKEQQARDKLIREQKQRDRVLLDTYTTERDLTAARDARVEAVDSQIQLSQSIIADAQNKLDLTEKRITQIKAQNKKVPQHLFEKMASEQKALKTHKRIAAGHVEKRAKVVEQFDGYIARFRELKAEQKRRRAELDAKRRAN